MRSNAIQGSFQRLLSNFLVFCGVFIEAATWFVKCRLNEIKDRLKFSRRLLTLRKRDVTSLGSWVYFVELLEKDKRQIEKDEHDEDNPSMPFWKLEILSGSYMSPFCLRASLKKFPRNLSRAAAGMFITLKISIDLLFAKPLKLFPLVVRLFHKVWRPVSGDEIRSSSSRLELSSSCSPFSIFRLSSSKTLTNQLES